MFASDMLTAGQGLVRGVSFQWLDENEDVISEGEPATTSVGIATALTSGREIETISMGYNNKTLKMSVTNIDDVASHSSLVEDQTVDADPYLLDLANTNGRNVPIKEQVSAIMSTHRVTFSVAPQFDLSADKSAVVFVNDDTADKYIKFVGSHLETHDDGRLSGQDATHITTDSSGSTTFYKEVEEMQTMKQPGIHSISSPTTMRTLPLVLERTQQELLATQATQLSRRSRMSHSGMLRRRLICRRVHTMLHIRITATHSTSRLPTNERSVLV